MQREQRTMLSCDQSDLKTKFSRDSKARNVQEFQELRFAAYI